MAVGLLLGNMTTLPYSTWDTERAFTQLGRNTGNLLFIEALRRVLVSPLSVNFETPESALERLDSVVIPASNWFGPRSTIGEHATRLISSGVPSLMVGLGAQAPLDARTVEGSESIVAWLEAIAATAKQRPNILTRGAFTTQVLERIGIPSAVLGCPSLFLNRDPQLGQSIRARWTKRTAEPRICVIAGLHNYGHLAEVDRALTELVLESRTGLPWVLQEGPELIRCTRGETLSHGDMRSLAVAGRHFAPHLPETAFVELLRDKGVAFFGLDPWIDHMKRFDIVVGPRFHGVMAGIAAGTPSVLVAHDSRTMELGRACGIPVMTPDMPLGRDAVVGFFEDSFSADAFDENRRQAADLLAASFKALNIAHHPLLEPATTA